MPIADAILRAFRSRDEKVAEGAALSRFLGSRAAFLSQKCVTEFCRVRAGVHWEKLFREEPFQAALLKSTWTAFTPALAMLAEMVEGVLRAQAGNRDTLLRDRLTQMAGSVRANLVLPPEADRDKWSSQEGLVADRLAHAALAAPRPVRNLADPLAQQVFDALPIHADLLTNDFDYIFNNLRMNLLRAHDDFTTLADVPALTSNLLGR
jgi:hypothetical protein